jgi:sugar lactone lactonase YvrE
MRRVLIAVLILALPTATAVFVYFFVTKLPPTNRQALGQVTAIAGTGSPGLNDGAAKSASFSDPFGIVVDKRGNVIVADGGESNRIRRISVDGKVHTIAGSAEGFADGNALQAQFNTPSGIAIDRKGNVIIADTSNNRIRKLSNDGTVVTTIAGSGAAGLRDGPAGEAEFDGPIAVATDKSGNVFVADAYNDIIRKIAPDGTVTTYAGTGSPGYSDGTSTLAAFDTPCGIATDREGNVFVADTGNAAIRKITPQGFVTTIAGRPDGSQQEGELRLHRPVGICITHDGFIFVTDDRGRIIRVSPESQSTIYAGATPGFANGIAGQARLNAPSHIAVDRQGTLYVADSKNYLIREIVPTQNSPQAENRGSLIQPFEGEDSSSPTVIPKIDASTIGVSQTFPWPLYPQGSWHEIAGVVGEARGAAGGIALDHIHSGLDIHGTAGEAALSVYDEKVSSPIANWDFDGLGEGIHVGLFSYIHIRVGRNAAGTIEAPVKVKARTDGAGILVGVRVRRGARFKVGDFIGTLNRLNHVHLNLGPWNAQANPLMLPFSAMKDTVAPIIESIEVLATSALESGSSGSVNSAPKHKSTGPVPVSGDVAIVVTAYDRVDGNGPTRKLGLTRLGYQLLNEDGSTVRGFEQPLMNVDFSRVPPEDSSVFKAYAAGSGVSAYGTPTKFRYIVTNRVRQGEAREGVLRTANLNSGNYTIRINAEDYAGNKALGPTTQLQISIKN